MTFHIPNAAALILAARPILKRGQWGNGKTTVCMMSALQPGATSDDDCVTAGWPKWLSILNHHLFDADVGGNEGTAAFEFALAVATAIQIPRDYDKARDLFLIATLGRVVAHDAANVVKPVIDLLQRRIAGEDVSAAMAAAAAAASVAAYAASAAIAAANASAFVAAYAARAAASAAARSAATRATRAASNAAARAALSASNAAARTDLIAALVAS